MQRVVDLALSAPPGEASHWTGRMLAKAAGVSLRSVQRILEAHQLAPHRMSEVSFEELEGVSIQRIAMAIGRWGATPAAHDAHAEALTLHSNLCTWTSLNGK